MAGKKSLKKNAVGRVSQGLGSRWGNSPQQPIISSGFVRTYRHTGVEKSAGPWGSSEEFWTMGASLIQPMRRVSTKGRLSGRKS